ncbi:unnamed protein product, partial [Polarella glacialis]
VAGSMQDSESEITSLVEQARREGSAASSAASLAELGAKRLEAQVRSLADAQARLLSVVEGISGDAERQYSHSGKAKADALTSVERVMSTVEELQRTVEQDGEGVSSRLREQGLAIDELRRSTAEDSSRHRATMAELQRLQSEAFARQRHCSDELSVACSSITATRQEVGELVQLVQRLERKLSGWREEVAAEVLEEVRRGFELLEADRLKLHALQREATAAAAGRIEMEARLESLRVELTAAASTKAELEARWRDGQQVLVRRVDGLESQLEDLRSELTTSTSTRCEHLEARLRDGQQVQSRRVDALQAAATQDVEAARYELASLAQVTQSLEQKYTALRGEVSEDIRAAVSSWESVQHDESLSATESLRRDVSHQLADAESRIESLQVQIATVTATRQSFEFRIREGHEETRQHADSWQRELAALNQRLSTSEESMRAGLREELAALQRRLGAEMTAEARALHKQEQNAIAALDEQLWLTDQRLGQRIDELAQVASRADRTIGVAEVAEDVRSPAPRTPLHGAEEAYRRQDARGGRLLAGPAAAAEHAFGSHNAGHQEPSWRRSAISSEPVAGSAAFDAEGVGSSLQGSARITKGGVLSMAHQAAEAFQGHSAGSSE